jgi:hypothetical protein
MDPPTLLSLIPQQNISPNKNGSENPMGFTITCGYATKKSRAAIP